MLRVDLGHRRRMGMARCRLADQREEEELLNRGCRATIGRAVDIIHGDVLTSGRRQNNAELSSPNLRGQRGMADVASAFNIRSSMNEF